MTLGLEGVTWLLLDAFGGVLCGVIDGRGFPFAALGLGEVRLMDGDVVAVDRREEDDADFEMEPLEVEKGLLAWRCLQRLILRDRIEASSVLDLARRSSGVSS